MTCSPWLLQLESDEESAWMLRCTIISLKSCSIMRWESARKNWSKKWWASLSDSPHPPWLLSNTQWDLKEYRHSSSSMHVFMVIELLNTHGALVLLAIARDFARIVLLFHPCTAPVALLSLGRPDQARLQSKTVSSLLIFYYPNNGSIINDCSI